MKKLLKTVPDNLSENMADQCTTHTLNNHVNIHQD